MVVPPIESTEGHHLMGGWQRVTATVRSVLTDHWLDEPVGHPLRSFQSNISGLMTLVQ